MPPKANAPERVLQEQVNLPTFADIEKAAVVLQDRIERTPLLESPLLNQQLGGRLFVKAECLQTTGSFKLRGATNFLCQEADNLPPSGVVAFSSGNHAQAVAYAAARQKVPALIIMPKTAPAVKIANTRAYGAKTRLYDPAHESREDIAAQIAQETGAHILPPFDHPLVIAGQGTVGLEIAAACTQKALAPDICIASVSGGGLVSGIALALEQHHPQCAVYGAEPEYYDDLYRSLEAGERVRIPPNPPPSIADALLSPIPGKLTFALAKTRLKGAARVSETSLKQAVSAAFQYFKLVVEPGGATALAALLSGKIPIKGKIAVAVLSGGNIDPDLFRDCLTQTFPAAS